MIETEEAPEIVSAEENSFGCLITGESKKAQDKEHTLQSAIRLLSSEYGFSVEDMERDFKRNV